MINYQKGAYEEVIPTSSQILSKLDLERLILVLRTHFVHITSRSIRTVIESSHIFVPNVYALAFLSICSYDPDEQILPPDTYNRPMNIPKSSLLTI